MRSVARELQRTVRGLRRRVRDLATGVYGKLAVPAGPEPLRGFTVQIALEQRAGGTAHAEAKRRNLALAAAAINGIVLEPGAIFSFWHIVGRPTARRGFVPGRSLVAGRVELDHGGGLCQISGILYHLALLGGLEVVERHPHTLDIYTEEARYTPLGADAAVAFGFKDLRIANPFSFPISLVAELRGERLLGAIAAPGLVTERRLRFEREDRDGRRMVTLYRLDNGETWRCLGHSLYIVAA